MGTINASWHAQHVMPKNPTREQRIAWHAEHAAQCSCRKPPPALAEEIARWVAEERGRSASD